MVSNTFCNSINIIPVLKSCLEDMKDKCLWNDIHETLIDICIKYFF